jgi:hypothetical protein
MSAQANSSRDPISKTSNVKKDWWSGSRCRPEVKPQYCNKKEKEERNNKYTQHYGAGVLEQLWRGGGRPGLDC